MQSISKHNGLAINFVNLSSERGFVLVAAILACMILLAVGILALTMSGQDIKISTRVVGEKKAFSACESGVHKLITTLDPGNLAGSTVTDVQVDSSNDPTSLYTIGTPSHPSTGPGMLPLSGYSIGGGQVWGQTRYNARVTGTNTNYSSRVQVDVGLGYGPIEMSTTYR